MARQIDAGHRCAQNKWLARSSNARAPDNATIPEPLRADWLYVQHPEVARKHRDRGSVFRVSLSGREKQMFGEL
jgi:hypothetical protein